MPPDFSCTLCGGRSGRALFSVRGFSFHRCRDCGLIQMGNLPEDREAGEDYSGFDLDTYRKFMAAFRVPQYERDISFIRKYAPGGRLLDVGCGTGEFLDVAGRNGFQAYGLEPSRTAYDIARQGRRVVRGELRNVEFKEEFFDVVTLWSVLEHIPAPSLFLGRIREILKKRGILALRIPDARGLLPSLALWLYRISLGRFASPLGVLYQLDWHYKHFYGYDRRTAGRLLEANGFEVIGLRSENGFDCRSLDLRLDYISGRRFTRKAVRGALGAVSILAKLLRREDELVLIALKA